MTRRSRMDIIIDILQAANSGASKTKIVYQANLNFNLARQYLDLLREQGLIEVNPAGSSIYKTTAQGRRYLEKASDLKLFSNEGQSDH